MESGYYLQNTGQSKINTKIKDFCDQIGDIKTTKDLKKLTEQSLII